MDRAKLEHFRELLENEKERYTDQINRIEEWGLGAPQADGVGELSAYDNHSADLGSETFERGKDIGLKGNAEAIIDKINEALVRIDEGTYGWCEWCGAPINEERLEAVPYTSLCLRCKSEEESLPDRHLRPAEEAVLYPPFGRSFRDGTGEPAFDGEDTWEAVAQYGTANSPQDVPGTHTFEGMTTAEEQDPGVVEEVERFVESNHDILYEHARESGDDTQV